MCNLLVPLCPFVLHSIAASDHSSPQDAISNPSADAKILFSYLSKRPYKSSRKGQGQTQSEPKPLALPSLKLYKRTNWHTCPCFFSRIAILHPLPGPSRPTFGSAHKYCVRCSSAAKLLRPVRRGGPVDRDTRNDPYWNRCIFLGASGVFEPGVAADNDDIGNGNQTNAQAQTLQVNYRKESAESPSRHQWEYTDGPSTQKRTNAEDVKGWREGRQTPQESGLSRRKGRYETDLDSYLSETYGAKKKAKHPPIPT